MIGARRITPRRINRQQNRISALDRSGLNPALMRVQAPQRLGSVSYRDTQPRDGRDHASIAGLPAALAVERRLVGQHGDLLARAGGLHFFALLHQSDHDALAARRVIACEFARPLALGNVEPHFAVRRLARSLPRRPRRRFLLRHRRVKTGPVHRDAARPQRVFGQVIRKAERVIELERRCAGQLVACAQRSGRLIEQTQTIG